MRQLAGIQQPKLLLVHHFSDVQVAVDKAALSKLRKKTGFQLIKCKQALTQFNNDIKQVWPQRERQREPTNYDQILEFFQN